MNIMQRIKDGANRATEKAQGLVEVNKIKTHMNDIEREMDIYFLQMGKVFYQGYQSQDMSEAETEMVKLSKACDTLWEEIEGLRGRIAELKNEKLCECGQVAPLDINYCPYCGTKLSEVRNQPRQGKSVVPEKESIQPEDLVILNPEYPDTNEKLDYPVNIDKQSQGIDRERRQVEELERERERQLELDRRVRYWKGQDHDELSGEDEVAASEESINCQICAVDLPVGSKWCTRCGAEQI
ncbi:zinc ribbon domain-containing protein [Paenibacillus crassostreae]|uniref:Zinc ribbon domain-containing protein n=1 Tax=Paenibacillus crassostreae TaxID=1763538 RepID=A0A167BSF7_9BACL|nr:zinc ribbon domain-containing protein [Paenibacillus crassostreae]AOZ92443.1 hypothetical protein LPB68_09495 [Paenibacillus crassostreae]OAB72391.1 hypothetical protein PNBC_15940 [Paenibacillus crassostreae]